MARRRTSTSPDRQELEAALAKGILAVDPRTGEPVGDLLLDPNVAGLGEEAEDLLGDDGDPGVARRRGPVGRQLLVDMSVDGWEEKLEKAYRDLGVEMGFDHDPEQPTEVTERG